eukprot:PhF_6_TR29266/c0_g1_i1/m.42867
MFRLRQMGGTDGANLDHVRNVWASGIAMRCATEEDIRWLVQECTTQLHRLARSDTTSSSGRVADPGQTSRGVARCVTVATLLRDTMKTFPEMSCDYHSLARVVAMRASVLVHNIPVNGLVIVCCTLKPFVMSSSEEGNRDFKSCVLAAASEMLIKSSVAGGDPLEYYATIDFTNLVDVGLLFLHIRMDPGHTIFTAINHFLTMPSKVALLDRKACLDVVHRFGLCLPTVLERYGALWMEDVNKTCDQTTSAYHDELWLFVNHVIRLTQQQSLNSDVFVKVFATFDIRVFECLASRIAEAFTNHQIQHDPGHLESLEHVLIAITTCIDRIVDNSAAPKQIDTPDMIECAIGDAEDLVRLAQLLHRLA